MQVDIQDGKYIQEWVAYILNRSMPRVRGNEGNGMWNQEIKGAYMNS